MIDKKLKIDPEGYGDNLHHPLHGLYKLKSSYVRIVYHIEAADSEVWILMIAGRRDIWDTGQDEILERYVEEVGKRAVRRARAVKH
ncbi:MAG: type II toxin-antitoxin system RelE family toxin [bacterium]